ncbi:MAG: glutamine-hydrolyzing GMP synthase [Patescibacteria group bacterium]
MKHMKTVDKVAVIDLGGQYAHLIANRVRRLGVYSEIYDNNVRPKDLSDCKGVILSGGPQSVYEKNSPRIDPAILSLGIPVLGICYGHQLIVHTLKGAVESVGGREYGMAQLTVLQKKGLFSSVHSPTRVWMSHGDSVTRLPIGFVETAASSDQRFSSIADFKKKIFGVQFHVEVTHTPEGMKMLGNFIKLCGAKKSWNMKKFVADEIARVKLQVGDRKVFMLVSGGVDSLVAFTLLNKSLGQDRVYGLFVDTGLMRLNEGREVAAGLKKLGYKNFHGVSAGADFFKSLKGVSDPEQKRKIIGDMFLTVQRREVKKLKLNPKDWLLGQGTIYPDTIETGGTRHADKIKTHHNRVPEIEEMIKKGLVVEPLKELYKDEVREVGKNLGLPESLVMRHPFPGPGLGVRCLCAKKADGSYLKLNDLVFDPIIDSSRPITIAAQHLLPIKSVGVQGDGRTYRHPLVLELQSQHDWEALRLSSPWITNKDPRVNRVLVLIAKRDKKPILSASITPSSITPQRIVRLQKADDIVMKMIRKIDKKQLVWQCPTVLIPVSINSKNAESIVLRPVSSTDAMTANFTELPWKEVQKAAVQILKIPGISAVFYDITNKPPGTIEWE